MSSPDHARSRRRPRLWVVLVAIVAVVALIAAGGLVAFVHLRNTPAAATSTAPPPSLRVVSTSPTGTGVVAGSTIEVELTTALAPNSPMPTLTPSVAGAWAVLSPRLLEYETAGPLVPGATETITVPGGPTGIIGSQGQHMAQTVTSAFTVAPGSVLRLQQLLAELGYLPLSFTPAAPGDLARRGGQRPGRLVRLALEHPAPCRSPHCGRRARRT